jgi:hypothetical protein
MRSACTESPASGGISSFAKATEDMQPGLISCKHLRVIVFRMLGEIVRSTAFRRNGKPRGAEYMGATVMLEVQRVLVGLECGGKQYSVRRRFYENRKSGAALWLSPHSRKNTTS